MAADLPTAQTLARSLRTANPGYTIAIQLPTGITRLTTPLELTSSDAGTTANPLIIRGQIDGSSSILGSIAMPNDGTDGSGNTIANLTTHGISVGGIAKRTYSGTTNSNFSIFQGDQRLVPARWPLTGFSEDFVVSAGTPGSPISATIPAHGVSQWVGEADLFIGGQFHYPWEFETSAVTNITGPSSVTIATLSAIPDAAISSSGFFIFNSVNELNVGTLGQYVYQSATNTVLYRPYSGGAQVELALTSRLIHFNSTNDIIIERLSLEKTTGAPIVIDTSDRITIQDSYIGHSGGEGITVNNGTYALIQRCVIVDTSEIGINVHGGTRTTLTPANHKIQDSIIVNAGVESFMYHGSVAFHDVGQTLTGSYLGNNAQTLFAASGNNHTVSDTEFTAGVLLSGDSAAITLGNIDWTMRGNVFNEIWVHNIKQATASFGSVYSIYLDNNMSGESITNSLFTDMDAAYGTGIINHGGRDNIITGNMFLGPMEYPITFYKLVQDAPLQISLAAMPYTTPPWSTQYPSLVTILNGGLQDDPAGCMFTSNIVTSGNALVFCPTGSDCTSWVAPNSADTKTTSLTSTQIGYFTDPITNQIAIEGFPSPVGDAAVLIISRRQRLGALLYAGRAGAL